MTKQHLEQIRAVYRRMERCNILSSQSAWENVPRLQSISKSLSRLAEANCNGLWEYAEEGQKPSRQELRENRLLAEAKKLAEGIGATLYHQSDPRGAAIYLIFPCDIPEGSTIDAHYSNGVAIY